MRVTNPIGVRQEPGRIPLLEEQAMVLNAALTAEVLRHAETRVRLDAAEREARAWRHFREREEACR